MICLVRIIIKSYIDRGYSKKVMINGAIGKRLQRGGGSNNYSKESYNTRLYKTGYSNLITIVLDFPYQT